MAISEKLYTVSKYEAYAEQFPEQLFELIDGRIIEKVTSEEHGLIVLIIGNALLNWRKQNKIKGYPTRQIIEVYFADGMSELFTTEHTLSGGDVLPNFQMAVGDIFDG